MAYLKYVIISQSQNCKYHCVCLRLVHVVLGVLKSVGRMYCRYHCVYLLLSSSPGVCWSYVLQIPLCLPIVVLESVGRRYCRYHGVCLLLSWSPGVCRMYFRYHCVYLLLSWSLLVVGTADTTVFAYCCP